MKEIGRTHVSLRDAGFKNTYWDALAKSLLDYLIGNGNTLAFRSSHFPFPLPFQSVG